VILLFFPGSGNWRALIPERSQFSAMLQMVKFYLSLGRFPLPNWYAHNPLWLPVYSVFFLILAACSVTGLLYDSADIVFATPMYELHAALAGLIAAFSVFHIVAAFVHDLKGKGAFISAMVNGFRYFHYTTASEKHGGDLAGKMMVSVKSIKRRDDA
jgi:Ni/Fe-hydrogenase 1 B-type cytochrome subunit